MRQIEFRAHIKACSGTMDVEQIQWMGGAIVAVYVGNVWRNIGDVELMEYTGIKDYSGTMIFEGDIVRSQWKHDGQNNYDYEVTGFVEWDYERSQWSINAEFADSTGYRTMPICRYEREEIIEDGIEVIGNIYDNPELLEVGE